MRLKKEKIAVKMKAEQAGLLLSICANILFVALELYVAYSSRSRAVLLDGLFDACETVLLLVSMRLMKLLYNPNSERRPVGYSNLEPLYMIMKGLIFCSIAAMMVITSATTMLSGGYDVLLNTVFYFEIFAGVCSLLVFLWMRRINRKVGSPVLALEIKEWSLDAIGSFGVGAAFLLSIVLGNTPLAMFSQYFDQIIMVVMALYILPTPVRAMKMGFRELFFLSPSEEVLQQVKNHAYEVAEEYEIFPEQLDFDVVKTGRRLWVSIYITLHQETVNLQNLRDMQTKLELRYISLADILDVDVIPEI